MNSTHFIPTGTSSQAEVQRLKETYQHYADCGFVSSKWSNENRGNRANQLERECRVRGLLSRKGFFPLADKRILDVGCGTGEQLGMFANWGARPENLFGVDLIAARVELAIQKYSRMTFHVANAESLPFTDDSFDLIAVFTLFSSILSVPMRANICAEICRVLAPSGAILWYDIRVSNPFNRRVRGLPRKHVQELFPSFSVDFESVSVLPQLARRLGSLTDCLYSRLKSLPCLRTHLVGILTKS